jgi:hypothetical protein
MSVRPVRAFVSALVAAVLCLAFVAPAVLAHEQRNVGDYTFTVGLIDEPVYVGQKSGLEFEVRKGDQPVEGLEKTLTAQAIYGSDQIDLPLTARFGQPGWYESVFFPTAAGPYTFHISGTVESTQVDERFTSSQTGFSEVKDAASGQFPVQLPSTVDLAAEARKGSDAAGQLPIAIGLGVAGTLLGLAALGVALAGRRREA